MNITFREADHTYWLGKGLEIPVPGFHEVLDLVVPRNKFYKNPDFYATRGRAVHLATALLDEGKLDYSSIDKEHVAPFLESYRLFKEEHDVVPIERELIVYDPVLMYAGTLDFYGTIDGTEVVMDLKCGTAERIHRLQVAAYARASGSSDTAKGACLYLTPKRSYKYTAFDIEGGVKLWEHIMYVYWWRKNEKI